MINRRAVIQERRRHVACRPILTGIGIALGLGLVSVSEADASTYRVYTDSAAVSMTLNANDGFCTLAEAVEHAKGLPNYNCTDFAPGSGEQRIELLASPNKPLSTTHFKITTLTLARQGVRIRIFGSGGFIDSTATTSAFLIPFKAIAFFERVTLTNTAGSAGGRLIENYGELGFYGVTITGGDVTGSHHANGYGGGIFNRNWQGLYPGVISSAENSTITGNKAKRGGGIYNEAGIINELAVTISNNTATMTGGGIHNTSTSSSTPPTNGTIRTLLARIEGNSARAGGGVFNRGLVELLDGSSITGNFTTTTGSSDATCTFSNADNTKPGVFAPCDGSGGGVLSVHQHLASVTRFQLSNSILSNNTASARGGGVYSVGVLELGGNTINNNRAQDGAAIYAVGPLDGSAQYCNIYGDNGTGSSIGPAKLHCNKTTTAGVGYSIVAGGSDQMFKCTFNNSNGFLTSGGNSFPRCQNGAFANHPCPTQITLSCPQP